MVIKVNREQLLPALFTVGGVIERKQALPILGNFLVEVKEGKMLLTATDLEIDIRTSNPIIEGGDGEAFTLPAKKFSDVCNALPKYVDIKLTIEEDKVLLNAGQSRYSIATLPAQDYPVSQSVTTQDSFSIESKTLKQLLSSTAFSIASNDARHYLNGALLDVVGHNLYCVATNGHRLALCKHELAEEHENQQILLPRKSVFELIRLLDDSNNDVDIEFGESFCRFKLNDIVLTTKLIDGTFPDYQRVIPKELDKTAIINREDFRHAIYRASLMSNDKYKGVKLSFSTSKLLLESTNNAQEKAEEELEIEYNFEEVIIGFNAEYLLNVVDKLDCKEVAVDLIDGISSIVIRNPDDENALYVIMPMRL